MLTKVLDDAIDLIVSHVRLPAYPVLTKGIFTFGLFSSGDCFHWLPGLGCQQIVIPMAWREVGHNWQPSHGVGVYRGGSRLVAHRWLAKGPAADAASDGLARLMR
jgi:hypothetical protein